ncbi:MAG: prolipoprotein diacylglyceryl transferase [Candidatus Omnitrophica bacterium]|nr:prolipoprotein diacylglyceryl transferase [Candidatus Omnitrophota bacterium]
MHPILFTIGPVTLYTYGAMMVAAFLLAIWLAGHAARRLPKELVAITDEQLVDLACYALLGGIIGGRLLYVALSWRQFLASPLEIFALWHGGLVWYGGLFGGLAAGWWYVRLKRLPWLRVADQCIPFVALGHAVGRLGCFFNGCCYGKPSTLWCAVQFPGHDHPVLPTQLFEAAGLCLLYLGLRRMQQPAVMRTPGRVLGAYLAGYGLLRFVLEYTRGDQSVVWGGLTLQQLFSIGILCGGLWIIFRKKVLSS